MNSGRLFSASAGASVAGGCRGRIEQRRTYVPGVPISGTSPNFQGIRGHDKPDIAKIVAGARGFAAVGLDACAARHDTFLFINPLCPEQPSASGMDVAKHR